MNDTYKYLLNLEIENVIRYIESYESAVATLSESESHNFKNELFGHLDIVDQSLAFFSEKLGINAPSNKLRDIYQEYSSKTSQGETVTARAFVIEKLNNYYDESIGLNRPSGPVTSFYKELYNHLEANYNNTYFDGDNLKPILQNNVDTAFEYFSQYRYLSEVASLGKLNNIPKPAVNWLNGDIKHIDDDIKDYNNRVDALNAAIEEAKKNNNASLTKAQKREKEELAKTKVKIIDECNEIMNKFIDANDYLTGVNGKLQDYEDRIKQYNALCKKLKDAQDVLIDLYKEYNDPNTPEDKKDGIRLQIETIFNDNRQTFNNAANMRKDIIEYGNILFSDVTLNVIRAERQVAGEFISIYRDFDMSHVSDVDLNTISDNNLKGFIQKYRQLSNTEEEIMKFLSNKRKKINNPNQIFNQSFAEEGSFDIDSFNNYVSNYLKRKRSGGSSGNKNKNQKKPINPIQQGDPIDLLPLKDVIDYEPNERTPIETGHITIDRIIHKVMGTSVIKNRQSRRYAYSKVHIFQNPFQKGAGNLHHFAAAVGGLIPAILRIPINLILKLYGVLQRPSVTQILAQVEKRANELTDSEVEVILRDYKNSDAMSRENIPSIFSDAIVPRVARYMQEKVSKINSDILKLILAIKTLAQEGDNYDKQANDETLSQEEREKAKINADNSFAMAAFAVGKFVRIKREGQNLMSGEGFEPLKATLEAHDSGMNFKGRFLAKGDYHPEVWAKLAEDSDYIYDDLPDRERVHKFINHQTTFIENTQYKRKAVNLFSKVSVGDLNWMPFIIEVNHNKDPFLSQMIRGAFMGIALANMINSIVNVIEHNNAAAATQGINGRNMEKVNKFNAEYRQAVSQHNDAVRAMNEARTKAEQYEGPFIDAHNNLNAERIGAIHQTNELHNLSQHGWSGSGKDYLEADALVHQNSTEMIQSLNSETNRIVSDFNIGKINHIEAVEKMQVISDNVRSSLQSAMNSASEMVSKQVSRGFDYTAWQAAQAALSSGADLTTVSSELMKTLLSLPKTDTLDMGQSLLLETTTLAEQNLLNTALLNAGTISAGLALGKIGEEKSKLYGITGDLGKYVQELLNDGVSKEKISEALEKVKAEYEQEHSKTK